MSTRFDKLIVWFCFKIANHNIRKWSNEQLENRIYELEHVPTPNSAEIYLLCAYSSHWYENVSGMKC